MNEAIERARKRAQAASSRHPSSFASSYQSPLGPGFAFDSQCPRSEQSNPYSIKGKRQRQQRHDNDSDHDDDNSVKNNTHDDDGNYRVLYEEGHLSMNGGWSLPRGSGSSGSGSFSGDGGGFSSMERMRVSRKEYVVERMKDRRKYRVRDRGEPNPYRHHHPHKRRHSNSNTHNNSHEGGGGKSNSVESSSTTSGCVIM